MKKALVIGMAMFLMIPSLAKAALIDFEELTNGATYSSIVYTEVTFDYIGTENNYLSVHSSPGAPLSGNVLIGPDAHQTGEYYRATFTGFDAYNVSVDLGDYNADQDEFVLYAYDSSNTLLDSALGLNSASTYGGLTLSVSAATPIAYVLFNETGNQGGYWGSAYIDNFDYTGEANAPVPEPATILLLGSGLLGMAGFRKKIKK